MAANARMALSRLSNVVGPLASRSAAFPPVVRAFSSTPTRAAQHWQQRGIVGSNLPFRIDNRYRLTLVAILFFGSGFNLPFLVVYHQLNKH